MLRDDMDYYDSIYCMSVTVYWWIVYYYTCIHEVPVCVLMCMLSLVRFGTSIHDWYSRRVINTKLDHNIISRSSESRFVFYYIIIVSSHKRLDHLIISLLLQRQDCVSLSFRWL